MTFLLKLNKYRRGSIKRKFKNAVNFTHRLGINNGFVLRDVSLMAGYMFPGFNQTPSPDWRIKTASQCTPSRNDEMVD